ncbi:MAG: phenylalanine 4-monooxygenase [Cytophagaceae bacterium]
MVQIQKNYTEQDLKNWTILYSRIMQFLPEAADENVLEGIKKIGFSGDSIPDFKFINEKIKSFSSWEIVPLEEMVDDNAFIRMLAEKKYPCRTWIRSSEQIETEVDEYDMFHDVIGHTPLLTVPNYCEYLTGLGRLAVEFIKNEDAIVLLKRMYWHSIQFGLKVSEKTLKIYGAHLLSSRGETAYSMSAGVPKYDFDVIKIMDTPYIKNRFQERYFVIESYDQLYNSLDQIRAELIKRIG